MKRVRSIALAAVVAVGFIAVALVGQPQAPVGGQMADAAQKWLATLKPDQKQEATYAFDGKERLAWFFTPRQDKQKNPTRIGLRLEKMSPEQKTAALGLLKTGLSRKGYEQATTIMSLEGLLADLEGGKGAMVRKPTWYFVSVFGEPSKTGPWGWRFEGHHMSVNYTLDKGEVVAATPLMFGANPADVKAGPKQGLRTLPGIEDEARALIKSLTPEQDKVAKQAKDFPEIKENNPTADVGQPVGISGKDLTAQQRVILLKLLRDYTGRMPESLEKAENERVMKTPIESVYFGYSGSPEPGKPYTYRVHGPEFVVEFLNVQADSAKNPANHIHSAWRRLPADFGLKAAK